MILQKTAVEIILFMSEKREILYQDKEQMLSYLSFF
jgi:hypothetical protein